VSVWFTKWHGRPMEARSPLQLGTALRASGMLNCCPDTCSLGIPAADDFERLREKTVAVKHLADSVQQSNSLMSCKARARKEDVPRAPKAPIIYSATCGVTCCRTSRTAGRERSRGRRAATRSRTPEQLLSIRAAGDGKQNRINRPTLLQHPPPPPLYTTATHYHVAQRTSDPSP
jgi:hypothetical protein